MNLAFFALTFLFEGVMGGQYCESYDYDLTANTYKTIYCEYGCCFFSCCSVAVVVVPSIIGGIIIIAVIVVICCRFPQCGHKKGTVVSPQCQSDEDYTRQAYNQQSPMYNHAHNMNNPSFQPVPLLLQPPMQQDNSWAHYPVAPIYLAYVSNQQQCQPMPQPVYDAKGIQFPPQPPAYSTSSSPPPPYSH